MISSKKPAQNRSDQLRQRWPADSHTESKTPSSPGMPPSLDPSRLLRQTRVLVARHPEIAVGVAALGGLALGFLLRRRR